MGPTIAFIAFFATVFGIMYLFYTTRHKERLALIEKGAEASLFNTGKAVRKPINWSWSKFTLKIGMLAMGIATGIIAGAIIESNQIMAEEPAYFSMVFFFGGLSLVLFYVIDRKSK
jgi:F0F1-type ATP synthase membrane subunit c/vacuolar-type H+-ATPase subunit K